MRKVSNGMIAALLLAMFAFGAALHINRTMFERLPHLEDEFAYLFQAKVFAGGHLWVERPAGVEVKVLWQPFVIQPNDPIDGVLKRFGKYTPGWPAVLALGILLNAPWITNAFLSALTVVLIYRLGREVFDEAVGLVAALLMAISPMALLLSATLMSHTSALFFTLLFLYGYWRTIKTTGGLRSQIAWGALAGVGIGMVAATRPLTAVAMAAPVALHALSRLVEIFSEKVKYGQRVRIVTSMASLALVAAPFAGSIFVFNRAVTGESRSELYTLQWDYDKVGFGEGHGLMPGGHTLDFGWTNARSDLGIWLRDIFGWTIDLGLTDYMQRNWGWGAGIGLGWLFVAIGLYTGRKNEWIWLFFELFIAIVIAQLTYWIGSAVYGSAVYSIRYYFEATGGIVLVSAFGLVTLVRAARNVPRLLTLCISAAVAIVAVGWLTLVREVLDYNFGARLETYLILALVLILLGLLFTSTRNINSRFGQSRFGQNLAAAWDTLWPGYIVLIVIAGVSLIGYTPARLRERLPDWPNGLYRYNKAGQQEIDALNAMRDPSKPVLVVVLQDPNPGIDDDWRNYGALMAATSPYLNSDIIVGRVFDKADVDQFVQRFPGRQVLYEVGEKLYRTVDDALSPDTTPVSTDKS